MTFKKMGKQLKDARDAGQDPKNVNLTGDKGQILQHFFKHNSTFPIVSVLLRIELAGY
jgi:hypothetical protein